MNYKLAFIGFGNVAQALTTLLERKRTTLKFNTTSHFP